MSCPGCSFYFTPLFLSFTFSVPGSRTYFFLLYMFSFLDVRIYFIEREDNTPVVLGLANYIFMCVCVCLGGRGAIGANAMSMSFSDI
jgi:hypothetical protein